MHQKVYVGERKQIFNLSSSFSVMHKAVLNGDISTAADIRMNLRPGRTESFMVNLNNDADECQHRFQAYSHQIQ